MDSEKGLQEEGGFVAPPTKRVPILWNNGTGKAVTICGHDVDGGQTEEITAPLDRPKPNTKYLQNVITNVDQGNKRKMAQTASGAGLQVMGLGVQASITPLLARAVPRGETHIRNAALGVADQAKKMACATILKEVARAFGFSLHFDTKAGGPIPNSSPDDGDAVKADQDDSPLPLKPLHGWLTDRDTYLDNSNEETEGQDGSIGSLNDPAEDTAPRSRGPALQLSRLLLQAFGAAPRRTDLRKRSARAAIGQRLARETFPGQARLFNDAEEEEEEEEEDQDALDHEDSRGEPSNDEPTKSLMSEDCSNEGDNEIARNEEASAPAPRQKNGGGSAKSMLHGSAAQPRGRGVAEPRSGTLGRDRTNPPEGCDHSRVLSASMSLEQASVGKRKRASSEAIPNSLRGRGAAEPRSGTMGWDRPGQDSEGSGQPRQHSELEAAKRPKRQSPPRSAGPKETGGELNDNGAVMPETTKPRGRGAVERRSGTMGRDGDHIDATDREGNLAGSRGRQARHARPSKTAVQGDASGDSDPAVLVIQTKPRGRGAMEPRAGMMGRDHPTRPTEMEGKDCVRTERPAKKSSHREGGLFRSALIGAANQ